MEQAIITATAILGTCIVVASVLVAQAIKRQATATQNVASATEARNLIEEGAKATDLDKVRDDILAAAAEDAAVQVNDLGTYVRGDVTRLGQHLGMDRAAGSDLWRRLEEMDALDRTRATGATDTIGDTDGKGTRFAGHAPAGPSLDNTGVVSQALLGIGRPNTDREIHPLPTELGLLTGMTGTDITVNDRARQLLWQYELVWIENRTGRHGTMPWEDSNFTGHNWHEVFRAEMNQTYGLALLSLTEQYPGLIRHQPYIDWLARQR